MTGRQDHINQILPQTRPPGQELWFLQSKPGRGLTVAGSSTNLLFVPRWPVEICLPTTMRSLSENHTSSVTVCPRTDSNPRHYAVGTPTVAEPAEAM